MWCYFTTPYTMLRKLLYSVILLSSDKPTWWEKIGYMLKILMVSAPVVWVLKKLHCWYENNSQFLSFVLVAILINMAVGLKYHHKMGTFNWREFFYKNIGLFSSVLLVYILLDMLRISAGDNIVGEGFKIVVQVTTLIYPISKALKNIYILNNKTFPPSFIMDKIYNFEKTGDVKELFKDNNENKL